MSAAFLKVTGSLHPHLRKCQITKNVILWKKLASSAWSSIMQVLFLATTIIMEQRSFLKYFPFRLTEYQKGLYSRAGFSTINKSSSGKIYCFIKDIQCRWHCFCFESVTVRDTINTSTFWCYYLDLSKATAVLPTTAFAPSR